MSKRNSFKARDKTGSSSAFTLEEREAMKARSEELRKRSRKTGDQNLADLDEVMRKIAEMEKEDRLIAERVHHIIMATAPELSPRTWYGQPAYSKDGNVICFFQPSSKFKTRYSTLGFSDKARLDEGVMWPTSFAIRELTPREEARIKEMVLKAVGKL